MTKQLGVVISADILSSLPQALSSMFLNNNRFASDGIAILSNLITHLKPSSRENLRLAINDLNHLEMSLGGSSINYISHVRGVSQCLQELSMDKVILLSTITILDHEF